MIPNFQVPVIGGFDVSYPRMIRVQQKFSRDKVKDIAGAIREQFAKDDIRAKIKPGMRVAIAVGSRGIANLQQIVASVVEEIKKMGGQPVIVPAMGSHGGATAEGQIKVLEGYGIVEEVVGCPIFASMETVQVGRLPHGLPLYFDKYAFESDAIVIVSRVKPHTSFKGPVESGLQKMLVVGLGKHEGATSIHSYGVDRFHESIPEAGKTLIEKTNIAIGVALIENAYDETCSIVAVPAEKIAEEEPRLLEKAKEVMARILLDSIDVLVVDEIGKDISGCGMDPNITGRVTSGLNEGFHAPSIQKIVIRDLSAHSHGNALGVGMADIITRQLFDKIDFPSMYANAVTSTVLASAKLPVILQNDKEALGVAVKTCNRITSDKVKIAWIKNTLSLEYMYVSEPCLVDIGHRNDLIITGDNDTIQFDGEGNLVTEFQF
ncbi:MAG: hypothetical protein K0S39_1278 [Paenibacillus sp.]|nr:hypothetical protein [Paenibacillus sp.]